jgi:hypothetical protein
MGLLWDEPYGMGYVINETVIWDSNCSGINTVFNNNE